MMLEPREPRPWSAIFLVCACALMSNASAQEEMPISEMVDSTTSTMSRPGHVTIVAMGFTIDRITSKFTEQGLKVAARGRVPGTKIPTFIVRDIPAREALELLVNQQNWILHEPVGKPGLYEIWDENSYKEQVLPTQVRAKVFMPKNLNAEEAIKTIWPMLTPRIGTGQADARSNKIFITDLPDALARIERMLEEMDVSFITRVFYVQHGDVESIADKLSRLKGNAAPRPEYDTRSRQIIVRDRLDKIRQMELLVETLDVESKAGTSGTPLSSWRLVDSNSDTATVHDYGNRDRSGQPATRVLRRGQPERVLLENVESTITLTQLPDRETSTPGAVAVFRVERAPADVRLILRDK